MLDEWNGLYKLRFISDNDLFEHVKTTVQQYSFTMDLKEFNRNIIDPIKLTFDMAIYNKSIADIIGSEGIRQIDKSNNNTIGYFHQNIFKYIGGNEWIVLPTGFDIVNDNKKIYVEIVKPDLKVHHLSAIKKQTPRRKSAPLLARVS